MLQAAWAKFGTERKSGTGSSGPRLLRHTAVSSQAGLTTPAGTPATGARTPQVVFSEVATWTQLIAILHSPM